MADANAGDETQYVCKAWLRRLYFVLRCHILTLFIITVASIELQTVVHRQKRINFFKTATILGCNFRLLYYIGFSFWSFIYLIYVRVLWLTYPWWFRFFFIFLMAWLSAPLIWLPEMSSREYEWRYATAGTMIVMAIHTGLSMFRERLYDYSGEFFIMWSVRSFVLSSLGIVLSIAWKGSQTDVCVAVVVLSCQLVLIILYGRCVGCIEFFEEVIEPNEYFYIIITHYIFICWYTQLLMAVCKIRCVMTPYNQKLLHAPTNSNDVFDHNSVIENFEYTY